MNAFTKKLYTIISVIALTLPFGLIDAAHGGKGHRGGHGHRHSAHHHAGHRHGGHGHRHAGHRGHNNWKRHNWNHHINKGHVWNNKWNRHNKWNTWSWYGGYPGYIYPNYYDSYYPLYDTYPSYYDSYVPDTNLYYYDTPDTTTQYYYYVPDTQYVPTDPTPTPPPQIRYETHNYYNTAPPDATQQQTAPSQPTAPVNQLNH